MQAALRPRKGFQNLGFGGVLSSLSFAVERKGATGGDAEILGTATGSSAPTEGYKELDGAGDREGRPYGWEHGDMKVWEPTEEWI